MDNYFKNKIVVVTSGANGIGKCIAEEFTKNGAKKNKDLLKKAYDMGAKIK